MASIALDQRLARSATKGWRISFVGSHAEEPRKPVLREKSAGQTGRGWRCCDEGDSGRIWCRLLKSAGFSSMAGPFGIWRMDQQCDFAGDGPALTDSVVNRVGFAEELGAEERKEVH